MISGSALRSTRSSRLNSLLLAPETLGPRAFDSKKYKTPPLQETQEPSASTNRCPKTSLKKNLRKTLGKNREKNFGKKEKKKNNGRPPVAGRPESFLAAACRPAPRRRRPGLQGSLAPRAARRFFLGTLDPPGFGAAAFSFGRLL